MAEIRLQYRWVPSALEPLPSLTHEGPWCRDAVPTGYKLEQRSYCCRAMGFSLGQWQRHPETKRRIMVAGSGATFFDEAARRDAIIVAGPSIGFSRHGEIFCDGTRTDVQIRPASCRCRPIAVSFHRLFLGGLLPSRARFRFAGYLHGIRGVSHPPSLSSQHQAHEHPLPNQVLNNKSQVILATQDLGVSLALKSRSKCE